MESRTFPDPLVWDSNYTACLAALDGRVYVGLNYHGKGATVAVYDPRTDAMKRQDRGLIRTEDDRVVVHPNAASAAPDGTIYFVAHVLEPDGEGRGTSNLPADLVLEKESEHKKQLYKRNYTMRLLIYRPQTQSR